MKLQGQANRVDAGYAMAALLASLAIMGVLLSVAMPVWHQAAKREKEEELIFRGKQYARAIALFGRKYAGASPPTFDVLLEQRFLRKKYKDPMVPDGEFQPLYQLVGAAPGQQSGPVAGTGRGTPPPSGAINPGQTQQPGQPGGSAFGGGAGGPRGNIIGVASKSTEQSIRLYNGRNHYNDWQFLAMQALPQPGAVPGGPRPGQPPGRGGPGGRGQGPGGMGPGMGPGGMGPGMGPGGMGPGQPPQFPGGRGRGPGG